MITFVFASIVFFLRHIFDIRVALKLEKLLRVQDRRELSGQTLNWKTAIKTRAESVLLKYSLSWNWTQIRWTSCSSGGETWTALPKRKSSRSRFEGWCFTSFWSLLPWRRYKTRNVDSDECCASFGSQEKFVSVQVYYHLEAGFYESLLLSVSTDVRRNDLAEDDSAPLSCDLPPVLHLLV